MTWCLRESVTNMSRWHARARDGFLADYCFDSCLLREWPRGSGPVRGTAPSAALTYSSCPHAHTQAGPAFSAAPRWTR